MENQAEHCTAIFLHCFVVFIKLISALFFLQHAAENGCMVRVILFDMVGREGHGNGNENQSCPVPFHWFHSHPVPAGSSENVNHSRPVPRISKPFPAVPFHQYYWTNHPFLK